jgi:hypothetical protein
LDFGIEFNTFGEFLHEIGELNGQRRWQLRLVIGPPQLPLPRSAARIVTVLSVVGVVYVGVQLGVPSAAAVVAGWGWGWGDGLGLGLGVGEDRRVRGKSEKKKRKRFKNNILRK